MYFGYPTVYHKDQQDTCELSDEIHLPLHAFRALVDAFEDESVLFVRLIHGQKNCMVTLGTPHQDGEDMIYVPQWLLDHLQYRDWTVPTLFVEKVIPEFIEDMPVATTIIIKPLDPIAFDVDLIACFERALVNLHSIEEHMTIPVYLPYGNEDIMTFAYIEQVEPAPLSRISQGEVHVEFVNDFVEPMEELPHVNELVTPEVAPAVVPEVEPEVEVPEEVESSMTEEEQKKQVREARLKRFV